jgi:hypothetical protein
VTENILLPDGPLNAKEARGIATVIAAQKGLKIRYVQDEAECARLQAAEKHGHIWRIGEQYYAVADLLEGRKS